MTGAPTADFGARSQLYHRLARRNRIVGLLRIAVPAFGVLVFAGLIVQIVIANIAENYGVSGIRLDRDAVIVDTPQYEGVMADGTTFAVTAREAVTTVTNTEVVDLIDARIELVRQNGYRMNGAAEHARYALLDELVRVSDEMLVTDSRGMEASLGDVTIDWAAQTLTAERDINVLFGDGTHLRADGLVHSASEETWAFSGATVILPGQEGTSE